MPESKIRTTIYVNPELIQTAKDLGINVSNAAEDGIKRAINKAEYMREQEKKYDELNP